MARRCRKTPSRSIASCARCAKASCASAWSRSARSSAHAVRRARPGARDAARKCTLELRGPVHGDRQVPDRADDGPGAPSGSQRREPRHRDRRTSGSPRGKRPEGTITLSASAAGEHRHDRNRRRRPRRRRGRSWRRAPRRRACRSPPGRLDSRDAARRCCARPASRPRTTPTAPADAAWAWRSSRTTVERAVGHDHARDEPGHGTRFTIQLPLTLAIADALIGRVGDRDRSRCRRARCAR